MQPRTFMLSAFTLGTGIFFGIAGHAAEPTDTPKTQETHQIAGHQILTVIESEERHFDVPGEPNHTIIMGRAIGSNLSTGKYPYLNGAFWTAFYTDDLKNGKGPEHGYDFVEDPAGSTYYDRYEAQVETEMVNGKPHVKTHGTWTFISGTGRYANGTGSGSFKCEVDPPHVVCDWDGTWREGGKVSAKE